jgi:hypothetical protein
VKCFVYNISRREANMLLLDVDRFLSCQISTATPMTRLNERVPECEVRPTTTLTLSRPGIDRANQKAQ